MYCKVSKSRRLCPNLNEVKVLSFGILWKHLYPPTDITEKWSHHGCRIKQLILWFQAKLSVCVKQTVFNILFLQLLQVESGIQIHTVLPHNYFWFCGLIAGVKAVCILLSQYLSEETINMHEDGMKIIFFRSNTYPNDLILKSFLRNPPCKSTFCFYS